MISPIPKTGTAHPESTTLRNQHESLRELHDVVPRLTDSYAKGIECSYKGVHPRVLIQAALDYQNRMTGEMGSPLLLEYFADPDALANYIGDKQNKIAHEAPAQPGKFFAGAIRISKYQHHAAVVGVVHADRSALMVLDSLQSKAVVNADTNTTHHKLIAGKMRRGFRRHFPLITGSFESAVFDAVRNLPNSSVYYTYTGSQTSSRDCASFTVTYLDIIQRYQSEQINFMKLLNDQPEHVKAKQPDIRGLRRIVDVRSTDAGKQRNRHFVVNGEHILPPAYYIYAQSRTQLARYCKTKAAITDEQAAALLAFHDLGRKTMTIKRWNGRTAEKTANFSIREAQISQLTAATNDLERRLAHSNLVG